MVIVEPTTLPLEPILDRIVVVELAQLRFLDRGQPLLGVSLSFRMPS
jgi:hypothetical protein